MSEEIWKPIPGFEYDASNHGRIRARATGHVLKPQRVVARHLTYLRVKLVRGQPGVLGRKFFVHRLVLEAFVGPRPSGTQARYLNGDTLDVRLENLSWSTGRPITRPSA